MAIMLAIMVALVTMDSQRISQMSQFNARHQNQSAFLLVVRPWPFLFGVVPVVSFLTTAPFTVGILKTVGILITDLITEA